MQEEQPRLLVQHVAVDRRHVDAVRPQRPDHGVHLVACKHKIAGDGGFATAGRLETDGNRYAHRSDRTYLHSILRHCIAARHCKLIDAAICLSFDADDLIKLRRVEIDSGWRGGCGWRRQWRLTCPESLTNNGGHFGWIAV